MMGVRTHNVLVSIHKILWQEWKHLAYLFSSTNLNDKCLHTECTCCHCYPVISFGQLSWDYICLQNSKEKISKSIQLGQSSKWVISHLTSYQSMPGQYFGQIHIYYIHTYILQTFNLKKWPTLCKRVGHLKIWKGVS